MRIQNPAVELGYAKREIVSGRFFDILEEVIDAASKR